MGFGYRGLNIVRNPFETDDMQVGRVVDQRQKHLAPAKKCFPQLQVTGGASRGEAPGGREQVSGCSRPADSSTFAVRFNPTVEPVH
jgi:hypothetical protein